MRKFMGWAKTRQLFSAVSGPKFTKLGKHVGTSLTIDMFLSDCWYHVPLQTYVRSNSKSVPKKPVGCKCPGEFGPKFTNSSHKWICVQVWLRSVQWHRRLGFKKEKEKRPKKTAVKYKPFGIAVPCGLITVTFDSHLRFDKHVITIAKACNHHVAALSRIRHEQRVPENQKIKMVG